MAKYKHLSDLLKICSVLPALAIMPAMADNLAESGQKYSGTIENQSTNDKNRGGAITINYDINDVSVADGTIFKNNEVLASTAGGAIKALNGFNIGNNVQFIENKASNNGAWGAGALYIKLANKDIESKNTTVQIGENALFQNNIAGLGGAIGLEYGNLEIANGAQFIGNHASSTADTHGGGAIIVWQDADDRPELHSTLKLNNATFEENTAKKYGGAIAVFDTGAETTINGGSFKKNSVTGTDAKGLGGGAIYNVGTMNVDGVEFKENDGKYAGGAIYNNDFGNLTISASIFDNNSAQFGGAINNARVEKENNGGVLTVTDSTFVNNRAWNGGAIRNQGQTNIVTLNNTLFSANTSTNGGAINNGAWGIVNINGAEFSGNTATLDKTLKPIDSNVVLGQGGAITNNGELNITDVTFRGNNAAKLGGAIHNETKGTITFDGNNVFAGNTAANVANDINNRGEINIASGTTTLDGGITGDGTLTLASGATLDIGSAKVVQKTIDLNGDIVASIVNANSFGQFVGDVDLSTDSELTLDVGAAGEYSIFADAEIAADKITYNDSVFNLTTDGNKIVVSTKSVDEIMENTNLSTNAASAVSIMANAKDDVLNTISLRAQQDMVAGKTGNAEKELAKLNPDDKPVAQSVASSVQNQVLSLAAGRMSGASVGRSGGDLTSADYGMWVQGLYNHSKYNGRFSGDTMGISVGADTLIDGKYTLGIGYAYNDTDVDSNSRDTAIESHSVFLYGQYKPNEWYVNAALNYTMSNYTESADVYGVKLADAEYDVNSFGGQIMTGYDFVAGNPASIFTPEVGVRYLHVAQDAYQGTLGDVDALDTDYLTGVAGVKYAFEIESASELKFRPELRAAATYDFMSDAAVATVNAPGNVSYVIDADRLSRFGGEFGIGLAAQYRGLEVSLNYDLDLHEDYTSQTGMLKFRYDF